MLTLTSIGFNRGWNFVLSQTDQWDGNGYSDSEFWGALDTEYKRNEPHRDTSEWADGVCCCVEAVEMGLQVWER